MPRGRGRSFGPSVRTLAFGQRRAAGLAGRDLHAVGEGERSASAARPAAARGCLPAPGSARSACRRSRGARRRGCPAGAPTPGSSGPRRSWPALRNTDRGSCRSPESDSPPASTGRRRAGRCASRRRSSAPPADPWRRLPARRPRPTCAIVVLLRRGQAPLVGELPVRGVGVPRRHRPVRHLAPRWTRPRPRVLVGEERHRRDLARPMAGGALREQDRRDVLRIRRAPQPADGACAKAAGVIPSAMTAATTSRDGVMQSSCGPGPYAARREPR